ncbi:MAG: aminotransferase class III-fold pyridoxal phosphate-dependent enzyme [Phycisphaerales bacterium]|nr:aminotransferase class III-fold pyridoxal phosphate-dependent enzyme [Phycisphaerales bacterium]
MTTGTSIQGLHPAIATPEVQAAIESVIAGIQQAQSTLHGVRGPDPARQASAEKVIQAYGEARGRGLVFPLMGSGLGRGALVELTDGSVKYDFITGIGVQAFGHGDLDIIRTALVAATGDVVMQGNLQCNEDAANFAECLLAGAAKDGPRKLAHCFLTNSGALANENALKICMQKTNGAPRVLTFEHCFAGRTTTMAQVGDSAGARQGLALNLEVEHLPYFNAADPEGSTERAVEQLDHAIRRYPGQHACLALEPLQGEGGFNVAPRSFFLPLMERAREAGIPVWFDEVQSFGRTEAMFRYQWLDLEPDVVTVGKMSQVCATLYTPDMNPKPGLLSATFIGSTASLRVGRRMLERLQQEGAYGEDGRHARLHKAFRRFAEKLVQSSPSHFPSMHDHNSPAELDEVIGGAGGMMRLTPYGGDGARIKALLMRLLDAGVIAFSCGHGPFHLRFLPPVGVLQEADIESVLSIVSDVLEDGS